MASSDPAHSLKSKRSTIKGLLTRFRHTIEAHDSNPDLTVLKTRLQRITETYNAYDTVQSGLLELVDGEEHLNEHLDLEDTFTSLVSRATDIINATQPQDQSERRSDTESRAPVNTDPDDNDVNLPKIHLPTFSGAYEEWPGFADQFRSTVHENRRINDGKKLTYLRSCLRDDAARSIASLNSSAANYPVAWAILEKRYNQPHLIVEQHLKALFDLPKMQRPSHHECSQFLSTAQAHIEALSVLRQPTRDTFLIYLLASRLDKETEIKWRENPRSREFPAVREFLDFLHERHQLLLATSSNREPTRTPRPAPPAHPTAHTRAYNREPAFRPQHAFATMAIPPCSLCKEAHYPSYCPRLKDATPIQRRELIHGANLCLNCLRPGHYAKECRSSKCRTCNGTHHTLLHEGSDPPANTYANTASFSAATSRGGLLPTALVAIRGKHGFMHQCRVLLDLGSQSHFISSRMADRLQLPKKRINLAVRGIHNLTKHLTHSTTADLHSRLTPFTSTVEFLVLDSMTQTLPTQHIDRSALGIPSYIRFADPDFYRPGSIDAIIGAPLVHKLLEPKRIALANDSASLWRTKLGWILTGESHNDQVPSRTLCNLSIHALDQQVHKFWEIEEVSGKKLASPEETACETHFLSHTSRDPTTGRYIVRLPFRDNARALGDSYDTAFKRLLSLERAFARNPKRKQQYTDFINEYLSLGHMAISKAPDTSDAFYLPHHAIEKNASLTTKLRVVFDGSAPTSSQLSLNDILMTGPTIQDDLVTIITRFRTHRFVLSADITKMYRQVLVHPDDRRYQRILWRESPTEPVTTYELNTVTYGISAAPFLAIRALQQLAYDESHDYPYAASVLRTDMYVDDLLTGASTIEAAQQLRDELIVLVSRGGFEFRKWVSNEPHLLTTLDTRASDTHVRLDPTEPTAILGIHWTPTRDSLGYSIQERPTPTHVTKRTILSTIAQLFDPLGLLGPVITTAKILLQRLWARQLGWDEPVPNELRVTWLTFHSQLPRLSTIAIQRNLLVDNPTTIQVHGFSDASEQAYGACLYLRSTDSRGRHRISLICSKSRVAPLKSISLPRLELCGAVLLIKLYKAALSAINQVIINDTYLWSDSTIVLNWINTPPHTLKTFVANRITEIQSLSVPHQWRHVPSFENPADLISRGLSPSDLPSSTLWYNGPAWLRHGEPKWPTPQVTRLTDLPESRPILVCIGASPPNHTLQCIHNSSRLPTLKRTFAYCLRFIHNAKLAHRDSRRSGLLSPLELTEAMTSIVKCIQRAAYAREIEQARRSAIIKGPLCPLSPFLDDQGVLRVGGRITRAHIPYDGRHPAIIPRHDPVTRLIIRSCHVDNHYAGSQATLAILRERYWVTDGIATVKGIIRKCVRCQRARPAIPTHIMGPLPEHRVAFNRPFAVVGIDYCGPVFIKERKFRNRSKIKTYIAMFICFSTKAVHVEVVTDLTTEAFIASLRRFAARRGKPTDIYSDNATNFVGANRELKDLSEIMSSTEFTTAVNRHLTDQGIAWHFIPPRSPHFGGLWEAAIKSFKHHFRRVIGESLLTYEALLTYVIEIEGILNSRPLTPLSSDPNDLNPLTPFHFLIGGVTVDLAEHDLTSIQPTKLSMWQHVQQMKQHFWNRWHKEYLQGLVVRKKWHTPRGDNITPGTMVILREDNIPPMRWPLGRIIDVHPGQDHVVRVVTVRTASGTYKRSVKKLAPLDVDPDA